MGKADRRDDCCWKFLKRKACKDCPLSKKERKRLQEKKK